MIYENTCAANHHTVIKGPFAKLRNRLWWRKHEDCPWDRWLYSYIANLPDPDKY